MTEPLPTGPGPSYRPTHPVRLVHTSDVHLGTRDAAAALDALVNATLAVNADLLLIAGDLFDHNRVHDETVHFLIEQLSRLSCPTVILPGNHDCLDTGSVYRRRVFTDRPEHIHVLDAPESLLRYDDLGLEIWGRPVVDHTPEFRPLIDPPPRSQDLWRVAMAHGHLETPEISGVYSSPIAPEHIAGLDCDYLALGHWDGQVNVSQGKVTAFYSGAPQGTGYGAKLVAALQIGLHPHTGTTVSRLPLDTPLLWTPKVHTPANGSVAMSNSQRVSVDRR